MVKPNGITALQSLGEDKLAEVAKRLKTDTLVSIAKTIQGEWNMLTDMGQKNLTIMLGRYKKQLEDKKIVSMIAAQVHKHVDVLAEVESQFHAQKERLDKARLKEAEAPAGVLLNMVSVESDRLMNRLQKVVEVYDRYGVIPKSLKKVSGQFTVTDGHDGGKVVSFALSEDEVSSLETLKVLNERAISRPG